ncbi:MAG: septum site-determining protein MinD [Chloroflexi bacterium]|nr:septum site-determining protein MinD [Chloroflexota bacterium]
MSARVITITSGKGGVGKTTTTANLGVALARRGYHVACVDADIGLRNLDVVLGLENRIVYDLVDVVEGRARLRQALVRDKRLPELQLLPAAQTRDKNAVNEKQMMRAVNEKQMMRLCDDLRQQTDFILIDSPAGIEQGFKNAIAPADQVLIVTTPEMSAVRDADRIIGLLQAAEKAPPQLILNRLRPSMVKRGDMLDTPDVLEILAIDLIGIVPEDEAIISATNNGMPVAFDGRTSSGKAFVRLAQRLLGERVPIPPLDESPRFVDRFAKLLRR